MSDNAFFVPIYKQEVSKHSNYLGNTSGPVLGGDLAGSGNCNMCARTGEEHQMNFFNSRYIFSESHRRWSLLGQNDPDDFTNVLPVRPGGE